MAPIKAALLGFGTVGQGVYESVNTHKEQLKAVLGEEVVIKAVLVKDGSKKREVDEGVLVTTEYEEILKIPGLQVVFEAIVGEEPGYTYLSKAIEKGCHVITANKVMFASRGKTLLEKAYKAGVSVGFEATTAGGTPIIRSISQLLQVNRTISIEAILNGTSNYILTDMRAKGSAFHDVLKTAQELGYAEADPVNDVEGYDAFYKLMILSELAFGFTPDWADVERRGITDVTKEHIEVFNRWGYRIKHLARIRRDRDQLTASVKPVLVDEEHPLFGIEGVQNAVMIETSLAGKVVLQGAGAGKLPTASAMVEDLTYVLQSNLRLANKKTEWIHAEERTERELQSLAVVSEKPLPHEMLAQKGIHLRNQEENKGLFFSFISCSRELVGQIQKESSYQIYEVAKEKAEETASTEKTKAPFKQVVNL
jgi:homoserine dehydrogenase